MASCVPNDLVGNATAFQGLSPAELAAVQTYLLCQILNSKTAVSCDPATLLAAAKCYMCYSPGEHLAVQTYVLCQELNATQNSSCLICGVGDPVDPPTCTCAIYYDVTVADQIKVWFWDNPGSAWQEVIG